MFSEYYFTSFDFFILYCSKHIVWTYEAKLLWNTPHPLNLLVVCLFARSFSPELLVEISRFLREFRVSFNFIQVFFIKEFHLSFFEKNLFLGFLVQRDPKWGFQAIWHSDERNFSDILHEVTATLNDFARKIIFWGFWPKRDQNGLFQVQQKLILKSCLVFILIYSTRKV